MGGNLLEAENILQNFLEASNSITSWRCCDKYNRLCGGQCSADSRKCSLLSNTFAFCITRVLLLPYVTNSAGLAAGESGLMCIQFYAFTAVDRNSWGGSPSLVWGRCCMMSGTRKVCHRPAEAVKLFCKFDIAIIEDNIRGSGMFACGRITIAVHFEAGILEYVCLWAGYHSNASSVMT
jgi:hypothetical protein